MDRLTPLLFLVFPLVFVVVTLVGFSFVARTIGSHLERSAHAAPEEEQEPSGSWERLPRPWWGNPLLWLGLAAVSLVLGLVVAPHFLPGAVVFLPLVWIGGWRWRPSGLGAGARTRTPQDGGAS